MRRFNYSIFLVCSCLLLNACGTYPFEDVDENVKLSSIAIENVKTEFDVGDVYQDKLTFDVIASYSNGSKKTIDSNYKFGISKFSSVDGYACSYSLPVSVAGNYLSNFFVSYQENGITKTISESVTNKFNSIFEKGSANCVDFSASINNVLKPNDIFKDNIDLQLDFTWENDIKEIFYMTQEREDISLTLNKEGGSDNVINQPLERLKEYTLTVSYKTKSSTITFTPTLGVRKVNKEDLTILPTDFNPAYSPNSSTKTMVVPVTLHTNTTEYVLKTWNATALAALENAYTNSNPLSYKSYYANLGLNMDILVTEPVEENTLLVEQIAPQNKPWNNLYAMINNVFDVIKTRYTAEQLAEFDSNQDGQIDNIHIIPNYDESDWGKCFWPHQGQTFNSTGQPNNLVVNTYCVGNYTKASTLGDVTQVHEQGHVFGLLDYYDYTGMGTSKINYVGQADMQSHNIFDWNSYSKLSIGLSDPYVITGYEDSVEVTIRDSATSNECLIIPADYATWNGSAYDEYFLVELFSKKGINATFWDAYGHLTASDYGVRVYHVDSRLYDLFKDQEASLDHSEWSGFTIIGANNCSDYTALGIGNPKQWGDFKQLTVIQKGGIDTFGNASTSARHYLDSTDLFYTNDVFDFANYNHFLSKSGQSVSSMDNGELFNWKFKVKSATIDTATIEVYR